MTQITLATLSTATAQQVFEQVATHLLTQGEKSLRDGIGCAYRGDNGLMCAAGCLIGDDEYPGIPEGQNWASVVYNHEAPEAHVNLVGKLQRLHDGEHPDEWRDALQSLAEAEGLEWNISASVSSHETESA